MNELDSSGDLPKEIRGIHTRTNARNREMFLFEKLLTSRDLLKRVTGYEMLLFMYKFCNPVKEVARVPAASSFLHCFAEIFVVVSSQSNALWR